MVPRLLKEALKEAGLCPASKSLDSPSLMSCLGFQGISDTSPPFSMMD